MIRIHHQPFNITRTDTIQVPVGRVLEVVKGWHDGPYLAILGVTSPAMRPMRIMCIHEFDVVDMEWGGLVYLGSYVKNERRYYIFEEIQS